MTLLILRDPAKVWGDQNLADGGDMKMLTATSGGRRCDPHLRMLVVGDASGPSGQNPAAMLLARGDIDPQAAYRWLHAEMNCVRASGLLQFTHPHICCHTGDAARVGKPAADLFFSTVWCARSLTSFEYPPAVRQFRFAFASFTSQLRLPPF